ncbi:MAG: DUF302 domain-containing protein [Nanoarchaeota archaeon]|nr:DUF302 domain-containing protein [Nanoarchaeota archaeon]
MFGYKKIVDAGFMDTIEKVKHELYEQGFGVLTEIDVKKTLKEKINTEMDDYVILGACNPPFAHKIIELDKELGLMLPCNVIVYRKDDKTHVSAFMPSSILSMIDNPQVKIIAALVEEKLKAAVDNV